MLPIISSKILSKIFCIIPPKLFRLALIAYWFVISAAFLWPNQSQQHYLPLIPHIDKLAHAIVYALLALLIFACQWQRSLSLGLLVMAALYGIGIEFIQDSLPGRSFSIADIVANCAGLLTTVTFVRLANKSTNSKQP